MISSRSGHDSMRMERPLKIGVDASCWRLLRGFGRHTRCLLRELLEIDRRNEYLFFVDSERTAAALPKRATARITGDARASSASGTRALGTLARTAVAISKAPLDIIFFPAIYSYVPVLSRAKKVVTLHDATAETFPDLVLHNRMARILWRAKTAIARRQADALIAVSAYARDQLSDRFHIPKERVQVVGEAPDPRFRVLPRPVVETETLRKTGFRAGDRAIVYVGGFSPHKNLDVLVDAFGRMTAQPQYRDVKLYLVGDYEGDRFFSCHDKIAAQVAAANLGSRVVFTGFLPDDDLVVLLNLAEMLVLPSMNEGFGLPAVEAAACGCPVIATAASPLPALLGDAMRPVDPRMLDQLQAAMAEILSSEELRDRMGKAGVAAAARLSWATEARRLLSILTQVAAR